MSLSLLLPSKHHRLSRTKFICYLNANHVYYRWLWSLPPLTRTWFYSSICNICLVFIPVSSIHSLRSIFQKFLCTPISLSANSQTKIENYYTHWNGIKLSSLSQSWENCIFHLQLETNSTNNGQLTIRNYSISIILLWSSEDWKRGTEIQSLDGRAGIC